MSRHQETPGHRAMSSRMIHRCGHEGSGTVIGKGESRRGGLTDQPSLQSEASRRRSRALSTSPVIADSCGERGESYGYAVSRSDGSTQPLTVESIIARWTSIAYRGPCIDLHIEVTTSMGAWGGGC